MSIANHVNTFGLVLDLFGASFLAWDVFNEFKDKQFEEGGMMADWGKAPEETEAHKEWFKGRIKVMRIGLILLVVGFLLQVISNYLPENLEFDSSTIANQPIIVNIPVNIDMALKKPETPKMSSPTIPTSKDKPAAPKEP